LATGKRNGRHGKRIPPETGKQALVFGDWERGGWSDLLASPGGQRQSQALIGDKVKVLEQQGDWSRIASQQNLKAWLKSAHLTAGTPPIRRLFEEKPMFIVTQAPGVSVHSPLSQKGEKKQNRVDKNLFIPFGAILPLYSPNINFSEGKWVPSAHEHLRLLLPDGSRVQLPTNAVQPVLQPLSLADALGRIKNFRLIPYQNGGNTRSAMDDSGLIFLLFRVAGVQTPRTLAGLRKAGKPVAPFEARAGDVVFFSASHSDLARPAVLLNNTTFIEAFPARSV
ncbi:MAG: C40 family peptidase, partial [Gammaproteobacteria bacterium]|nr:C40 family peptidase [Gammaproteobacteria bacterium]